MARFEDRIVPSITMILTFVILFLLMTGSRSYDGGGVRHQMGMGGGDGGSPDMSQDISQNHQTVLAQDSKPEDIEPESSPDPNPEMPSVSVESHDKSGCGVKSQKSRIDGSSSAWTSSGPGWDIRVDLRTKSTGRKASSLDWATRWERATGCLSFPEPDNVDMFDMDELALEAFWARVWECYLPYAYGLDDIENE